MSVVTSTEPGASVDRRLDQSSSFNFIFFCSLALMHWLLGGL
jgi:hypothetical protein